MFQVVISGHVETDTTEAGNANARQTEEDILAAIGVIVAAANRDGVVVQTVTFSGQFVNESITPVVAPEPPAPSEAATTYEDALDAGATPAEAKDAALNPPAPEDVVTSTEAAEVAGDASDAQAEAAAAAADPGAPLESEVVASAAQPVKVAGDPAPPVETGAGASVPPVVT